MGAAGSSFLAANSAWGMRPMLVADVLTLKVVGMSVVCSWSQEFFMADQIALSQNPVAVVLTKLVP